MDNSPSTSASGGLLNVGRRSIRRLTNAVKRKRGATTAESVDAPAAKALTRNTAQSESKFSERKSRYKWKKIESKKYALPGAAEKQEQVMELAGRGSGQRGDSVQRKNRVRRPSVRGTNKARSTSFMSWPFKRSHGKLDLQNLPSPDSRPSRERAARSNRKKAGTKIKAAVKTEANETGRGTREEGALSANGGQRIFWKDAGGDGEDGAHRRAKKRRRRRKSQSDADFFHRAKAPKQTHAVTIGLCTPKRPRREEQTRRCKPKKLAVPKEEFLSLKKKLEWELTFNLYCRQKSEFMEINKGMYDCDDCDART